MNNKNIVTVMGYLALTSVFVAIAAFMFKSAKENRNYDVILGDKSNYSQTSFTSNELNNDIVLTSDSDEINSPINSSPTSTENVENNNENSNDKPQISDNQNNKTSSGKKQALQLRTISFLKQLMLKLNPQAHKSYGLISIPPLSLSLCV